MAGDLEIRVMDAADLARAVDWAAAEGWNPGLADAAAFRAADPGGFLAGRVDGEMVSSVSVVRYGPAFAFLGFYIVAPAWRGRGHGIATWRAGLALAGERTIGLDGVVAQQGNYARSGFVLAHRNVRYGGRPAAAGPRDAQTERKARIVPVAGDLVETILAYDRAIFGFPRESFLHAWLAPDRRTALAFLRDGAVAGYGVVRTCRSGAKIGPLFADDEVAADALFRALAALHPDGPVFLDPPEPNGAATALAVRHGLAPVFETARMYRGPAPALPLARIYGITTFELG